MQQSFAVLALAVIACGQSPSGGIAASPHGSAPPALVATPARAASSAREASPPPQAQRVQFPSCRLPWISETGVPQHFQGGFISGSDGSFSLDPAGGFTATREYTPTTDAKPALTGSFSTPEGSYDRAVKRWLPVRRDSVRSDGLAYAYAEAYKVKPSDQLESQTHIHVVSLPDGTDRVIYSGGPYAVLAYEPEGIYIVAVGYYHGESSDGLWRVDPRTEQATKLYDHGFFISVANRAAWTLDRGIQPEVLTRIDLSNGGRETWLDVRPTGWVTFMGTDGSGHPLIVVKSFGSTGSVLMAYSAPQTGNEIAGSGFGEQFAITVTDTHGTWLGGSDGIYLYQPGHGMLKVSDLSPGYPAGACA